MPARLRLRACVLLLLVGSAVGVASSQDRGKEMRAAYDAVLDRYRSGDVDGALQELLTHDRLWTETAVASFQRDAAKIDVQAAVLMHSDLVFSGMTLPSERDVHLNLARRLVNLRVGNSSKNGYLLPDRFRRDWHLTVAWYMQEALQYGALAAHLQAASDRFPNDAEVQLAIGSFYELLGWSKAAPVAIPRTGVLRTDIVGTQAGFLKEAEIAFRASLATPAPDDVKIETRVRLGRVVSELGRPAEALDLLKPALAEGVEKRHRYLATMFSGSAEQRANRPSAAADFYREATTICSGCQTAWIALSAALRQQGDRDAAYGIVLRVAASDPDAFDPWSDYRSGQAWRLYPRVWEMRKEIAK